MRLLCTSAALMLLATASCAPAASSRGLDDPVPSARLAALHDAVARKDASPATLRRLVEHLDSDDVLVRTAAIDALVRLTGERRGYDPVAARSERDAAVTRWVEALTTPPAASQRDGDHG